jgi:hypothetical protein
MPGYVGVGTGSSPGINAYEWTAFGTGAGWGGKFSNPSTTVGNTYKVQFSSS